MAKKPVVKKKAGRPSKFESIDVTKVGVLAARGWTDVDMASFFDVSEVTWNAWKKKHPEFLKSLKDWKIEADNRVERSLYERACGYSHPEDKIFKPAGEEPTIVPTIKHYAPDSTACIFWLKNRKKSEWRDKQPEGGEDETPQIPVNIKVEVVDARKPESE